jgi:hypothetical protein
MKIFIRNLINKFKFFEFFYVIYLFLFNSKKISYIFRPTFNGWGMVTSNHSPFDEDFNDFNANFRNVHKKLLNLVNQKKFHLSQFLNMFPDKKISDFLNELMWRHYIVYSTVQISINNNDTKKTKLVECGVCDGLTIFYAINAVIDKSLEYSVDLFDAWEGMKENKLSNSENKYINQYSFLDIEKTKKNLQLLNNGNLNFHKGIIPECFNNTLINEEIDWLHIDLNSHQATLDSLNQFWQLLKKGGIILFDDYALISYEDTKKSIDNFIKNKNLSFIQFPTGQAMIIKSNRDA